MNPELSPELYIEIEQMARGAGLELDELVEMIIDKHLVQARIATAPRAIPMPKEKQTDSKRGPKK